MSIAIENKTKIVLHNWIIANREDYKLLRLTITDNLDDFTKHHLIHTIQGNLNRLMQQKIKSIETYLYLYDFNAEGDKDVILDFILDINDQIKLLLCL